MLRLVAFCLGLLFSFLFFPITVNADQMSIQDLLSPELAPMNGNIEGNQSLIPKKLQERKDGMEIDDLLGPEDNFPFLPDNHRDSGTGKFNSF